MAKWLKQESQWHEKHCHDPIVPFCLTFQGHDFVNSYFGAISCVRTPVRSNLECVVLLSKSNLDQIY